jgi:hypothetical protein
MTCDGLPSAASAKEGKNYSRLMLGQLANADSCLTEMQKVYNNISKLGAKPNSVSTVQRSCRAIALAKAGLTLSRAHGLSFTRP